MLLAFLLESRRTLGASSENWVVRLNKVSHHFGTRKVFSPLEITLRSGETGVITGVNGSGKSTLFRIIAGLLQPANGSVEILRGGKSLDATARRSFIGYVSPDLTLYRELTGAENLRFFSELQGRELRKSELAELLNEVGLKGRGRDLVGSYSSGMRQRLKYAFALLNAPPILLLDEPTANLDVSGREMVERILARQREHPEGGVTLIATNEPRELDWGDILVRLERAE